MSRTPGITSDVLKLDSRYPADVQVVEYRLAFLD